MYAHPCNCVTTTTTTLTVFGLTFGLVCSEKPASSCDGRNTFYRQYVYIACDYVVDMTFTYVCEMYATVHT